MPKLLLSVAGGVICLGLVQEIVAYCTACQVNLFNSPEGRQLLGGLQQGVVVLLAVPVTIAATVGFLLLRARRQKCHGPHQDNPDLQKAAWDSPTESIARTPGSCPLD